MGVVTRPDATTTCVPFTYILAVFVLKVAHTCANEVRVTVGVVVKPPAKSVIVLEESKYKTAIELDEEPSYKLNNVPLDVVLVPIHMQAENSGVFQTL